MPASTHMFVRPELDIETLNYLLEKDRSVLVKMRRFDFLMVQKGHMMLEAYFGQNEIFEIDEVGETGYEMRFQRELSTGTSWTRISANMLKDDFFIVDQTSSFSQERYVPNDDFLRPGTTVQTTETTRFLLGNSQWSKDFETTTKFKVLARDDDSHEFIVQSEDDVMIQLHLTNACFFKPVDEPSVASPQPALPLEVLELQALVYEQQELLTQTDNSYRKLFTKYQNSLKRRSEQASGAGGSLQPSILDELLEMAMCPILGDTPGAGDMRILQNGQLVSQSGWDAYRAKTKTPTCPLTRETITQNPIVCPALRNLVEALQTMKDVEAAKSVAASVDQGHSDQKKRKL